MVLRHLMETGGLFIQKFWDGWIWSMLRAQIFESC
jgi:hypothetical protein